MAGRGLITPRPATATRPDLTPWQDTGMGQHMARKNFTPEEAQARREAKQATVDGAQAAALEALTDPATWLRFLAGDAIAAKYSPRNQMLIRMQAPHATDCAGYTDWRKRGRQVRAGETGILVFGPRTRTVAVEGGKMTDRPPAAGEESASKMCGTTIVSTFDISQTDPIPGKAFIPPPAARALDVDEARALIEQIGGGQAAAVLEALEAAEALLEEGAELIPA